MPASSLSALPQPDADVLLTTAEAAAFLRLQQTTLEHQRVRGDGPPFVRLGRRVFYRHGALIAWIRAQERTSTAPTVDIPRRRHTMSAEAAR